MADTHSGPPPASAHPANAAPGEASEEVLRSIRRMIAGDDAAATPDERPLVLTDVVEEPGAPPAAPGGSDALLSPAAAESGAAAIARLTGAAREAAIAGKHGGNHTVEEIVVAMLQPMLREWLDANLPDIIERAVKDEISRLADTAGGGA